MLEALLRSVERIHILRGVRRGTSPIGLSFLQAGKERGNPPIVLVHGLGTTAVSWIRVISPLAKSTQVLVPELPGYGQSPPPPGKDHANLHDCVVALESFLKMHARKPVVLVGQSLGGWVCALLAARRPDLVDRLMLVNSAGIYYKGVEELKTLLRPNTRSDVIRFWKLIWHHTPAIARPFWKSAARRMQGRNVAGLLDSVQRKDFLDQHFVRLNMPVALIWGMSDGLLPRESIDQFVLALPRIQVWRVPRCGHMPALERPATFVRIMKAAMVGA